MSYILGAKGDLVYNSVMRGLYIHIPFCKTRCHYCNFVTTAGHTSASRGRFFKALSAEIKNIRERLGLLSFDTLYLGGGTPSCLTLPEIKSLISEVRSSFEFKKGYEFTCEFNPGDGEDEKFAVYHSLGVNRVSLGCQAFQEELLKKMGRRHTVRDIAGTVAGIWRAGIRNISLDLMLRLPGQTVPDFQDSLRQCVELEAAQISLYDLEVHEETPFGDLEEAGKLGLPGEEEHARMYESAIKMLTGAGYEHYEISNFAKPGLASQHNLIYWRNQEYRGLGPGAFTYQNGVRSQFALGLDRYLEKCEAGQWQNDIEDKLSEEEKETETLVTGLRLCEGVVPLEFPRIYPALKERFKTLCAEGLMEIVRDRVRLTDRGKFLSEDVFKFLLRKEERIY